MLTEVDFKQNVLVKPFIIKKHSIASKQFLKWWLSEHGEMLLIVNGKEKLTLKNPTQNFRTAVETDIDFTNDCPITTQAVRCSYNNDHGAMPCEREYGRDREHDLPGCVPSSMLELWLEKKKDFNLMTLASCLDSQEHRYIPAQNDDDLLLGVFHILPQKILLQLHAVRGPTQHKQLIHQSCKNKSDRYLFTAAPPEFCVRTSASSESCHSYSSISFVRLQDRHSVL